MVWIDLISDVKVYYQVYDILKSIIVLIMKFMRISIPIIPEKLNYSEPNLQSFV